MRIMMAEMELMKRMAQEVLGLELQSVFHNGDIYVGMGNYESEDELIDLIVVRCNGIGIPLLTLMEGEGEKNVMFKTIEYEGRRYMIMQQITKTGLNF